MLLGVDKRFVGDAVELDMTAAPVEIRLDKVKQVTRAPSVGQSGGQEFHIEVVGNIPCGVHSLGRGLDKRRRPFGIRAGRGRNTAVGERHTLLASVGEGVHDGAVKVVEGQGIGIKVTVLAEIVRAAFGIDRLEILKQPLHIGVAFGVVIPVLGHIKAHLLHIFIAHPVSFQGFAQRGYGEQLLVKDQFPDGVQGVARVHHSGENSHALRILVSPRLFRHAGFNAAVMQG